MPPFSMRLPVGVGITAPCVGIYSSVQRFLGASVLSAQPPPLRRRAAAAAVRCPFQPTGLLRAGYERGHLPLALDPFSIPQQPQRGQQGGRQGGIRGSAPAAGPSTHQGRPQQQSQQRATQNGHGESLGEEQGPTYATQLPTQMVSRGPVPEAPRHPRNFHVARQTWSRRGADDECLMVFFPACSNHIWDQPKKSASLPCAVRCGGHRLEPPRTAATADVVFDCLWKRLQQSCLACSLALGGGLRRLRPLATPSPAQHAAHPVPASPWLQALTQSFAGFTQDSLAAASELGFQSQGFQSQGGDFLDSFYQS